MKGEGFIMNITDVRVRRVAKEGKMKAVVSITIDEEFVVHDIKVIEGEKGLFIAMPSRKATDRLTMKHVKKSRELFFRNMSRYLQKNRWKQNSLQNKKNKSENEITRYVCSCRHTVFAI